MNRTQALTKARKLLGPKAAVEWRPNAPDEETRAAAFAALPELRRKREAADKALNARRDELLAADPDYQRLREARNAASRAYSEASSASHSHRATVGTVSSMAGLGAFLVCGQGETFEAALAKAEAAQAEEKRRVDNRKRRA